MAEKQKKQKNQTKRHKQFAKRTTNQLILLSTTVTVWMSNSRFTSFVAVKPENKDFINKQQSGSEYVTVKRCRRRDFHIRVQTQVVWQGSTLQQGSCLTECSSDEPFDLRSPTDGNDCKTGSTCWIFSGSFAFSSQRVKLFSFLSKESDALRAWCLSRLTRHLYSINEWPQIKSLYSLFSDNSFKIKAPTFCRRCLLCVKSFSMWLNW